jgi:energy-coupling factor transport system substrate-specific component
MVIFGVISELIASKSRYMNFKLLTFTYVFYIVAYYLGALAPIYYWTEFFTQAGGSNAAHGEAIIAAGHTPAAFIGVVVMIVAAIVSAFLARRMLKRHFVKAGIISERVD